MSLARLQSVAFVGLDAVSVEIEVDASKTDEKQILVLVGLPDATIKESRERVMGAIKNSGFFLGGLYCTINLAPGDLRKEGALYDLPIALGIMLSLGILSTQAHQDYLIVGELGLSGEMRPIRGALALAIHARQLGKKGVLIPSANVQEAAAVPGIQVIPLDHLKDAVQFLKAPASYSKRISEQPTTNLLKPTVGAIDFSDIKGQAHAKRALEIAAAGGHNIAMSGPPGSGKTMLARALIGIMPALTLEEALETTRIHSIAGLVKEGQGLITQRPFRSPHHTVSYAGLIGGGAIPQPGEVTLAHNGILFLDELPEFSRMALEVLRQPLEDRQVTISRAQGRFTYPTRFICVTAMNPCPCGYKGHPDKVCKDTDLQVERYRGKISGPLWDRLDMHIEVPALRYQDIINTQITEPSATIRMRVDAARKKQYERYGNGKTNALMGPRDIKTYCPLNSDSQGLLRHAVEELGISARAADRLLRLSRTIADLEGSEIMRSDHLMEAINFRHKG